MNGILIDVPQLAYKTWCINVVDKNTGERLINEERELKEQLSEYSYNKNHEHVR